MLENLPEDMYTTDSIQILHFVTGICKRPQMYTINGTLEEVGAFLEGFYSGMCAHSRDKIAIEAVRFYWFDFCDWATNYLFGQEKNWVDLFQALKQLSPDESVGFAKLIELYDLYLAIHPRNSE
jgi:hypothetical protein